MCLPLPPRPQVADGTAEVLPSLSGGQSGSMAALGSDDPGDDPAGDPEVIAKLLAMALHRGDSGPPPCGMGYGKRATAMFLRVNARPRVHRNSSDISNILDPIEVMDVDDDAASTTAQPGTPGQCGNVTSPGPATVGNVTSPGPATVGPLQGAPDGPGAQGGVDAGRAGVPFPPMPPPAMPPPDADTNQYTNRHACNYPKH